MLATLKAAAPVIVLGLAVSCGAEPAPISQSTSQTPEPSPPPGPAPPPAPAPIFSTRTVLLRVPATVTNEWASVDGTVSLEESDAGTHALVVSTGTYLDHFVASALWVFPGTAAPDVGTHLAPAAGSEFRCSDLGGDPDWCRYGVEGRSGACGEFPLEITEASDTTLHGRLSANLKFTRFSVTF